METIRVATGKRTEMIEITGLVKDIVAKSGVSEGIALIYVPHTTAAVTINENADSSVKDDLIKGWSDLAPAHLDYRHAEGNSDAHIKASLVGVSVTLIIDAGQIVLGTWQGIYFCEFDGPRPRRVLVQIVSAS